MSGMWKRSHGRTSEAPPDERGGYRYVRPTATAPHLDSTLLGHSVCRKMLVSTRTPAPRPLSLARLTHDRGYHCRVGAASLSSVCASARGKPARPAIPTSELPSSTGTRLMRWCPISCTTSSRGVVARDPSASHQDFEPSRACRSFLDSLRRNKSTDLPGSDSSVNELKPSPRGT